LSSGATAISYEIEIRGASSNAGEAMTNSTKYIEAERGGKCPFRAGAWRR